MGVRRVASVLLVANSALPAALANVTTCWIKEVTFAEAQVQVTFLSALPLVFTGTATALSASSGAPYLTTLGLTRGQSLQVKASDATSERCQLEPILGPQFNGVSRSVWLQPSGSSEPVFLGSAVKARPR